MEAVIFIGLPASGKSSFFQQRFCDSHIRLNLDMLRTRHRERILFEACLEAKQPFVIDNTNPGLDDRRRYIEPARRLRFTVVGYYFPIDAETCLARNAQRGGSRRVPDVAIKSVAKKLVRPALDEGFDVLRYVRPDGGGGFVVEEYRDEI